MLLKCEIKQTEPLRVDPDQWYPIQLISIIVLSFSFLRKLTQYVIMPDSWLAVIWEQIVLAVLLIMCFVYTFVATFSISLHALGYGENFPMKILLCFTYLLDAVLVADFVMRFNMASVMVTGDDIDSY